MNMEDKSRSNTDDSKKFLGSTVLFVFFVIVYIYWFAWGVTKLVIGAVYVNDCDDVQMIPIFLIVDGFIYIPFAIGLMPFYKFDESSDSAKNNARILLIAGLVLFIGWTATGSVFVYSNNGDDVDCSRVLRTFANVTLGLDWGTIGLWGQLVFRVLCFNRCGK